MPRPCWTCLKCCEIVDDEFDVCWLCGTSRDGHVDPSFVTADDHGPIYDPLVDRAPDPTPNPLEELPEPLPELVECYTAPTPMEAHFVAGQLRAQGIPALARRTTHVYSWLESVFIRADDVERARPWLDEFRAKRRNTTPGA